MNFAEVVIVNGGFDMKLDSITTSKDTAQIYVVKAPSILPVLVDKEKLEAELKANREKLAASIAKIDLELGNL
jgi:hypothetical protein